MEAWGLFIRGTVRLLAGPGVGALALHGPLHSGDLWKPTYFGAVYVHVYASMRYVYYPGERCSHTDILVLSADAKCYSLPL
jgi:hypothetical protein